MVSLVAVDVFSLPPFTSFHSCFPFTWVKDRLSIVPLHLHLTRPSGWGMILLSLWSPHHQHICWYMLSLPFLLLLFVCVFVFFRYYIYTFISISYLFIILLIFWQLSSWEVKVTINQPLIGTLMKEKNDSLSLLKTAFLSRFGTFLESSSTILQNSKCISQNNPYK